ncbi:mammalian cell entry protein [Mycobacterium lentiflavum]|uniref:Mammalian cell entry protein n=1 Tax=Mycobacterium lentiflavum TaxID=141349 RepID=A0ABY3UW21_MYCLN|nr:mammalian cell entry protein [Mycobacterium lentiflavum]ULP41593.1 mammalian cell entry protein [Mycobacterium lentiflavum]
MAINADAADGKLDEAPAEERSDEAADCNRPDHARPDPRPVRFAIAVGLTMVIALGAVAGTVGYRAYQSTRDQMQRNLFVQTARQGALNLTTIDYTEVDTDVARILNLSTGAFRDDFQRRSQPFIDVVKQAQSKSQGSITEAGLESQQGDSAQVLVAVTVNTSTAGVAEPQPRAWRMRIAVQKLGDGAKVSDVEFVP